MKIPVLDGSPAKNSRDTLHITRAFAEGVQELAEMNSGAISGPAAARAAYQDMV